MFEPNISTVMNPFTVKQYDMQGNEVEEIHWRYFTQTGNNVTKDEARRYVTIKPKSLLEEIWVKWCQDYCA